MVMINRSTKEIAVKIVYYGPGLCGKTTNIEYIYKNANPAKKGKLLTVATETDRTLFFDFLPMDIGSIHGMKLRVQLYTVPGQVFYDATRRIVLRGSDGVVFVADSQRALLEADQESLENLKTNLHLNGIDTETIPLVIQYNKRDLPNIATVEEIDKVLNWRHVPTFESVAIDGRGVHDTVKKIIELVLKRLQREKESVEQKEAPPKAAPAPVPVQEPQMEEELTPVTEPVYEPHQEEIEGTNDISDQEIPLDVETSEEGIPIEEVKEEELPEEKTFTHSQKKTEEIQEVVEIEEPVIGGGNRDEITALMDECDNLFLVLRDLEERLQSLRSRLKKFTGKD